jgi:Mu transposase, C-terminal./Bacteriophage Mu transposase.
MLYDFFVVEAGKRGWERYPSVKTVRRYVRYLMDKPAAESARFLAANGLREWKNKKQIKGKRDSSTLDVMEYVVADAHTFDLWVKHTAPNGKVKAIRPMLVAWLDQRTRRILGVIACEHSNSQIVKESFVKMVYQAGCVPKHVHIDNGKDFASNETLGQNRSQRSMEDGLTDAEEKGFYLSMGAKGWSRSLPFQPWDKTIERAFNTFCLRYSRKFASYTGTLTASKTEAKRRKDISGMLERGELLTLEEFLDIFQKYLDEDYDARVHRGLKDAGEQWATPAELWANASHHVKAVPPREYAAMLLMKPATARVTNQGINKFRTLYTADELAFYVDKTIKIRWDVDDVTKLYCYNDRGESICEAYSAELMQFGDRISQAELEELHSRKNRQLAQTREALNEFSAPYEIRSGQEQRRSRAVGTLDLMVGNKPQDKIITLPEDKEFRSQLAAPRSKKGKEESKFFNSKADDALSRLRAIND